MTPNIEEYKKRLKSIIAKKSLLTGGDWQLASGRKSNFYFNIKSTSLDAEGSYYIANLIIERLKKYGINFLGGVALGGIPLISSVSTLSFEKNYPINVFFVRKATKSHGEKSTVEGLSDLSVLRDKRVIIVEDVTTTGASCLIAVRCARDKGAIVERVITLVDRCEGATSRLKEEGIILESFFVANDFLSLPESVKGVSAKQAQL